MFNTRRQILTKVCKLIEFQNVAKFAYGARTRRLSFQELQERVEWMKGERERVVIHGPLGPRLDEAQDDAM